MRTPILRLLITTLGVLSTDHLWDPRTMARADSDCENNIALEDVTKVEGCPKIIPITLKLSNKATVLAGKTWAPGEEFNNWYPISDLSCKGSCENWFVNSKYTSNPNDEKFPPIKVVAAVINPGCTLYVFRNPDFKHRFKAYKGPATILPVTEKEDETSPFFNCAGEGKYPFPCANSLLWTCQQTLPTCTFSDEWQTVARLDNSLSTETTTFTYEKTVGVQYSYAMGKSVEVSTRVAAEISAELWILAAKFSGHSQTGYKWNEVDTEVKSKADTFTVQVTVPAKTKIKIEVAVGICGDNYITTQMYKTSDGDTNKVLQIYNGKVTYHKISGWKGKGKGKGRK